MLTVRFVAHPVTSCTVREDGQYLKEEVAVMEHVITPRTQTYPSLGDVKAAFEVFIEEVAREETPALVIASDEAKIGERKFFGFEAWAKAHRRIKYDLLNQSDERN